MEGYNMCQRMKNQMEVLVGKFKLSKIPEKLWTYLIVDFITKFSIVVGKNTIPVIYNKLSKMIYFVAIMEGILVSGTVHTRDKSSQDRLGNVQTCETTLASAYILCRLSVA